MMETLNQPTSTKNKYRHDPKILEMVNAARKMYVDNFPFLTIAAIARMFDVNERSMWAILKGIVYFDKSYRECITLSKAIALTQKMMDGGISPEDCRVILRATYDIHDCEKKTRTSSDRVDSYTIIQRVLRMRKQNKQKKGNK